MPTSGAISRNEALGRYVRVFGTNHNPLTVFQAALGHRQVNVRFEARVAYPDRVFTNLARLMDVDFLAEASHRLRKNAAPGLDGVTFEQYAENLAENLQGTIG